MATGGDEVVVLIYGVLFEGVSLGPAEDFGASVSVLFPSVGVFTAFLGDGDGTSNVLPGCGVVGLDTVFEGLSGVAPGSVALDPVGVRAALSCVNPDFRNVDY